MTVIFHKIKFNFLTFIVKFLKNFILNTNYQVLYKLSKKSFNSTIEILKNINDPKLGRKSQGKNDHALGIGFFLILLSIENLENRIL